MREKQTQNLKLKYKGAMGCIKYFGRKSINVFFSKDSKKWQIIAKNVLTSRQGYFDSSSLHLAGTHLLDDGILLVYFVKNPLAIGAALADKKNPEKIVWRSANPLFKSEKKIAPLATEIKQGDLIVYFKSKRKGLFQRIVFPLKWIFGREPAPPHLERFFANPIFGPIAEHPWESQYVFNPGAIHLDEKVHLIYRAVGGDGVSRLGYAWSRDGMHIDERLNYPIFVPEGSLKPNPAACHISSNFGSGWGFGGCEDPRLTRVGGEDKIYMVYTAFNGSDFPRIARTSIKADDFLNKQWNWKQPVLISSPGEVHKNWVIFPEKINGKYAILHSLSPEILVQYSESLEFDGNTFIKSYYNGITRKNCWDAQIRGAGPPPIRTKGGWLLFYHAIDKSDPGRYKFGAMILDINDPTKILYRSGEPLLEPDERYENEGFKPGVVYTCGAVVINNRLFVYYGGADTVVCVATKNLDELLEAIKQSKPIMLEEIKR